MKLQAIILTLLLPLFGFAQVVDNTISRQTPKESTERVIGLTNDNSPDRRMELLNQVNSVDARMINEWFDQIKLVPDRRRLVLDIDNRYRTELDELLRNNPHDRVMLSARTRNLLTLWGQEIELVVDEEVYDDYVRRMLPKGAGPYSHSGQDDGLPGGQ